MARKQSYAALTRQLTGMSAEQYKREYTKFAAQVRNYNAVAGSQYSPAKEFYYSKKYAGDLSPALEAILQTPATRARSAGASALTGKALQATEARAAEVVLTRWDGFIRASMNAYAAGHGSGEAQHIAQLLDAGLITAAEAERQFKELAHIRDVRREKDPAYQY